MKFTLALAYFLFADMARTWYALYSPVHHEIVLVLPSPMLHPKYSATLSTYSPPKRPCGSPKHVI